MNHESFGQEDYSIISSKTAFEIMAKDTFPLVLEVKYNLCKVYKISKKQYLVCPLNPFRNCLLSSSLLTIKKFENENLFPDNNEQNTLYYKNKTAIDNLDFMYFKEEAIKKLEDFFIHFKFDFKDLSADNVEFIYAHLKSRRKLKSYGINILFLMGDFIIKKYGNNFYEWAIIEEKFSLNPTRTFVIKNNIDNNFFEIENKVFGKYGFDGLTSLSFYFNNHKSITQPPLKDFFSPPLVQKNIKNEAHIINCKPRLGF